jgi:hypothetical protein
MRGRIAEAPPGFKPKIAGVFCRAARKTHKGAVMRSISLVLIACALGAPGGAQWLKQPTAGIPRNADGKPNLSAPPPRAPDGHPDLSGLWRRNSKYPLDVAVDLQPGDVTPWAEALFKQRADDLAKDSMGVLCLPWGPSYATLADMAKIIQTPSLIVMLHWDLTYRQIYMDGRALEKDPNPNWMGYSVGRCEGDTLVVESAEFNDRTWLDPLGHPHTEALRTTERYRRLDFGRMELLFTLDDPKAYTKPWRLKIDMTLAPDTEMLEYVCNESENSRPHLVGTASDDRKRAVQVAPEILAKYVGNYQMGPSVFGITLEQGQLVIVVQGIGKLPLIPLSESAFTSPLLGPVDFGMDAEGTVTHMILPFVAGDARAVRKK